MPAYRVYDTKALTDAQTVYAADAVEAGWKARTAACKAAVHVLRTVAATKPQATILVSQNLGDDGGSIDVVHGMDVLAQIIWEPASKGTGEVCGTQRDLFEKHSGAITERFTGTEQNVTNEPKPDNVDDKYVGVL